MSCVRQSIQRPTYAATTVLIAGMTLTRHVNDERRANLPFGLLLRFHFFNGGHGGILDEIQINAKSFGSGRKSKP
jgi:hypothetical protein